ncbi:hypothetical protein HZA57_09155, partial [Candidatus Poribacteria bacterium]|nr:hypothetical protein [Candidatus Poribacteria bacterium]
MSEVKEEQGGVQVQEPKKNDSVLDAVIDKQNQRIPYELNSSEKLQGSRIRYSVTVPAETFNGKVDEVLSDLRKEVNVPGFRRGKAPVALVRNRFLTHARQEAIRKMVPRISSQITEDCGVENLGQPVFEGWEPAGGAASLKIVHEVRPEINITTESLAGLKAEVTEQPVDDARVEKELQTLREKSATWEAIEGAAFEKADGLSLDSEVFDEHGVALEYLSRRNHYSQRIEQEFPASVVEA